MVLTIEVGPEIEEKVRAQAARRGQKPEQYASELVAGAVCNADLDSESEMDPRRIMQLPLEERRRILAAAADAMADLYAADLAPPVEQRELTAFTALDFEPFYDYEGEDAA